MNDVFFDEELYEWLTPIDVSGGIRRFSFQDKATITFMWVEGDFYLNSIWVEEEFRNQGVASEIMRRLAEMSDRYKVKIILEVVPLGAMTRNFLISFYQKYGFVVSRYGSIPGMTRPVSDKRKIYA